MSKPDEDELDDLDDLLDDFAEEVLSKPPGADLRKKLVKEETNEQTKGSTATTATTATVTATATATATASATATATSSKDEATIPELDEEFASKLKLGMDYLLGEMEESPEAKESFESLLKGITSTTTGATKDSTSKTPPATATTTGDFHDTISQTMNRLNESRQEMDEQGTNENDFFAEMMKELGSASGGGNGSMDMTNLLEDLLEELSSKDILYEPIKEMRDKFPDYLAKNEKSLNKDDLVRYKQQRQLVEEMCNKFDDPKYEDNDPECRKYITERMEAMQKSGAPPPELMGDLASGSVPGLEFGGNGMPKMPEDLENCNVQ